MTATSVRLASDELLQKAFEESWYFIAGTGGALADWVNGYEDLMEKAGIGKPLKWLQTTGAQVNALAASNGDEIAERDRFQPDLICLLLSWEGLHVGKLAMFKIQMQDRWFDDVIQNMRRL